MRATILFLALAIAVGAVPAHLIAAGGDYRSKVDRAYKHIRDSESRRDMRLKAIERDAAREMRDVDSPNVSKKGADRKTR